MTTITKTTNKISDAQKLVERVVKVAIENEVYSEDLQELVDWALVGNKPEEFYVQEAAVE